LVLSWNHRVDAAEASGLADIDVLEIMTRLHLARDRKPDRTATSEGLFGSADKKVIEQLNTRQRRKKPVSDD
jgi:hypothetical protein